MSSSPRDNLDTFVWKISNAILRFPEELCSSDLLLDWLKISLHSQRKSTQLKLLLDLSLPCKSKIPIRSGTRGPRVCQSKSLHKVNRYAPQITGRQTLDFSLTFRITVILYVMAGAIDWKFVDIGDIIGNPMLAPHRPKTDQARLRLVSFVMLHALSH